MANFVSNFTGAEIDALLNNTEKFTTYEPVASNSSLDSLLDIGNYSVADATVANTLSGWPVNVDKGAATIYVRPVNGDSTKRVWQILLLNAGALVVAIRRSAVNQQSWDSWCICVSLGGTSLRKGTTAQRPVFTNVPSSFIGFVYIDIEVGKPIFWTNDTSDGKTGWVDATGANV